MTTMNEFGETDGAEEVVVDEYEIYDDNQPAREMFMSPQKTPMDGVKKLWSEVLVLAAKYAKGEITNDHDCCGKPEVQQQFRKSAIRFLCGSGNLKLACEAAGIDMLEVRKVGKRYEGELRR
jgi:hypothetical protein